MRTRLYALLAYALLQPAFGADSIATKTTHAAAYGPTNNAVAVDPAKDLPRYPAVEAKDAAATWQVKKGFRLELAAHEPQVRDPIAICFDERGRMFVCEMIDYSEMRDVTPHLGRVSMLEDRDADGYYESSNVFADDLPWPTGLIWARGALFVGATPDIWRFEDKDGDGRAEVREKVYTGFGTGLKILNVQGMLNSFQWGLDNKIHVLAGGGNRGKIKCLKRDDLPELELGGRDFWFDPSNYEFGMEAGGAQYGMSFDNHGRKFGCSNSDHLQAWTYDSRYAERNPFHQMPPARKSIAVDGGAAEVFRISPDEPWRIIRTRWRIAGVVKGAVEGGGRVSGYFTGATGTTIYRGDAYGPAFINNSFTGDAGGQLIHRKIIGYAENGIDLEGARPADEHGFEFAASKDTWVRVVNFANAPDGCLHVCDMYREVIEHPWSIPDEIKKHLDLNSGNDRGRVWRIVPDKPGWTRRSSVSLAEASTPELVGALTHVNGWHRDTAARLLHERRDQAAIPLVLEQMENTAAGMQHALAVLEGMGALDEKALLKALSTHIPALRERALLLVSRVARGGSPSPELWKRLEELSKDSNRRVRFQLALTLGDLNHPGVPKLLADLPRTDVWMAHAVLSAPPGLAHPTLMNIGRDGFAAEDAEILAGLVHTIAARGEGKEVADVLAMLSQLAQPDARYIAALAGGLKRAGTSLERVDTAKTLVRKLDDAAATVANSKGDERARLENLPLAALADPKLAIPALAACLDKTASAALQAAAVRHLTDSSATAAGEVMLKAWPVLRQNARELALGALTARKERTIALLEAISAGTILPADLGAARVQALVNHRDSGVAALAKKALATVIPPSREEVTRKFQPALSTQGDAAKGQLQFMARCFACHRAGGQGMQVGPDLVTVKTKGREALLTAILDPHKEVASQFIAYNVNTKDGQTLSGIIANDDANSMTLRMMGGAEVTLPRSNIKGSSSSGQSLMPEGLEQGMTVPDMADLLAYIEALQ